MRELEARGYLSSYSPRKKKKRKNRRIAVGDRERLSLLLSQLEQALETGNFRQVVNQLQNWLAT